MATNGHSHEQGLRVHHLANLGGLVAIAGLDHEPPDFLLGALLSVAHERATLDAAQRARVAAAGRKQLEERATSKRAWKSWSRAKKLHSVTLSSAQVREIIGTGRTRAREFGATHRQLARIAHGVEP
jgi:hypothetical protein